MPRYKNMEKVFMRLINETDHPGEEQSEQTSGKIININISQLFGGMTLNVVSGGLETDLFEKLSNLTNDLS